jgi:quercetin dioxygenase-like cupin family protein
MSGDPHVVREDELEWETWEDGPAPEDAGVAWKTLVGAPGAPTDTLTLGVARLLPGSPLREHRHAQAEVYLVLAGTGEVAIDGARRAVGPGSAVFIPGGARHGLAPTGEGELRIAYAFAADAFADVEYDFGDG